LIRARFLLSRRQGISNTIRRQLAGYEEVAAALGPEFVSARARVPPMLGVDEDMRDWSLAMILEHNAMVNRSITAVTESLARDEEPTGPVANANPKTDFDPSPEPGIEQLEAFRETVEAHLKTVAALPNLRGTRTKQHPVFGAIDAHGWHGTFSVHLQIHLAQARALRQKLLAEN
jgi:hypothetical protein